MTFDARAIKLLLPGQHITSSDFPGLRIIAGDDDLRTWIYRYRSPVDGKLRQVKIGNWPAKSLHLAIADWDGLKKRRDAGEDPALQSRIARNERRLEEQARLENVRLSSYTVRDVALDYWEGHVLKTRKQKGATEVKRMFDKMLGETGNLPAAEITRAQAFDLISEHGAVKPVVAGYLRSELGAAWDYAIDAGRLPGETPNWWRVILRGKLKSKGKRIGGENIGTKKRVLTPEETGKLINWLPNFTRLIDDTLTLYLWTACRGVEILGAEGKDIIQESDGLHWWVIPKEKTKNARHDNATDLRVPLFGRAKAVLLRRKGCYGDGLLFPAKRRDGVIVATEQKTIQTTVWMHQPYSTTRPEDFRNRLTVTNWAPHDLRRTSRTFLSTLGCPRDVAESIIGHMLPGVEGVYNKNTFDKERVEWLGRLSEYLESLAVSYL